MPHRFVCEEPRSCIEVAARLFYVGRTVWSSNFSAHRVFVSVVSCSADLYVARRHNARVFKIDRRLTPYG